MYKVVYKINNTTGVLEYRNIKHALVMERKLLRRGAEVKVISTSKGIIRETKDGVVFYTGSKPALLGVLIDAWPIYIIIGSVLLVTLLLI